MTKAAGQPIESEREWFGGGAYGSAPWGFGRPARTQSRFFAATAWIIVVALVMVVVVGIGLMSLGGDAGSDQPPPPPTFQPPNPTAPPT